MAVRYAGDVTIRIEYRRGRYVISYSGPGLKGGGTLLRSDCGLSEKDGGTTPETYDKVAKRVVKFLKMRGIETGNEIRRVFQAPCPVPVR